MTVELSVLRDSDASAQPDDDAFRGWVDAALGSRSGSLALRIVDAGESRRLNAEYRDRDRPTNVLSFPADLPEEVASALPFPPLGDLVICASLVREEAAAQGKPEAHHWAHLTIHGVLHLLGHDHLEDAEAEAMESLERELLARFDIPDPYAVPP